MRQAAALLAAMLVTAAPLGAQPPQRGAERRGDAAADAAPPSAKADDAAKKGQALAPVEEQAKSSDHSIVVNGRPLRYRATAGTLTLRDRDGKPTASMFYVAYTSPAAPGRRKPVTFFYNGGPGSASLWLHMGSFGPMRVQTANPEYIRPAPYPFGPNPDTLLDRTDLVFLDAIGTGYSRPLGDAKPADFYGVDQDVDAFAKGILRYTTKNARWNDPKFIFGESYGTTRSAALAYALQDRGLALNGVVILSSILNYGIRQPGFDQLYIGYLPSYAATAWYHHKAGEGRPSSTPAWRRRGASPAGPMPRALAKGQELSARGGGPGGARDEPLSPASRSTSSSAPTCASTCPASRPSCCATGARRSAATTAAIPAPIPDAAGERPDYDPSDTAISGAFIATLHDYLSREIGYETDLDYRVSARDGGDFHWTGSTRAGQPAAAAAAGGDGRPRRGDAHQSLSQIAVRSTAITTWRRPSSHRARPQAHDAGASSSSNSVPLLPVRPHGLSEPRGAAPHAARPRPFLRRGGERGAPRSQPPRARFAVARAVAARTRRQLSGRARLTES